MALLATGPVPWHPVVCGASAHPSTEPPAPQLRESEGPLTGRRWAQCPCNGADLAVPAVTAPRQVPRAADTHKPQEASGTAQPSSSLGGCRSSWGQARVASGRGLGGRPSPEGLPARAPAPMPASSSRPALGHGHQRPTPHSASAQGGVPSWWCWRSPFPGKAGTPAFPLQGADKRCIADTSKQNVSPRDHQPHRGQEIPGPVRHQKPDQTCTSLRFGAERIWHPHSQSRGLVLAQAPSGRRHCPPWRQANPSGEILPLLPDKHSRP